MNDDSLPMMILKPAEFYLRTTPTLIKTFVGSCLAIIMFDPQRKIAAISHPTLPYPPEKTRDVPPPQERQRYVRFIIPDMVRKMSRHGISADEIEVKLFGGGELFHEYAATQLDKTIGKLNIRTAMELIRDIGLHLKTSDVGGRYGRKIFLYTHTGEVCVESIESVFIKGEHKKS